MRSKVTKSILNKIIAFGVTLVIFIIFPFFSEPVDTNGNQKCEKESWWDRYSCKLKEANLLDFDKVESFSIIAVAILYVLGSDERKKQAREQAYLQRWQLIDGARRIETSGARFKALEKLYEDGYSLKGLDARKADLSEIDLSGADLQGANLQGALLNNANLQGVNLRQAKLQKANLRGANLQGADLWSANLEGADLQERQPKDKSDKLEERIANLEGANLGKSNLKKAILNNANLRDANLRAVNFLNADLLKTDFRGAKLSGADFRGAKNLTLEQIKEAEEEWNKAKYDRSFCQKYPEIKLSPHEDSEDVKKLNKIEEINEILKPFLELRKLIETGTFTSPQNTLVLEDIRTSINRLESLITKDESISPCREEVEAKIRKLKADLHDAASRQERIDTQMQALKQLESESAADEEPYMLAAKWLDSEATLKILIDQGINNYLSKANIPVEFLDSPETINQLKIDLKKCLRQMRTCLYEFNEYDYDMLELSISTHIISEVFQLILDKIIPDIFTNQTDVLPNPSVKRLKHAFKKSITNLGKKSDFV